MNRVLLLLFAIFAIAPKIVEPPPCLCLNGGSCNHLAIPLKCLCPPEYIGDNCHIPAIQFNPQTTRVNLTKNYTYFYFEPKEANYYKLNFDLCMLRNPASKNTLFYIETERSDGSLRMMPSPFETVKIVLKEFNCTTFSTHYISIKPKQNNAYLKIVIGLKMMEEDQMQDYFNIYFNSQVPVDLPDAPVALKQPANFIEQQEISIRMSYETYLKTTSYSNFILIFATCVVILILIIFVAYLKDKRSLQQIDIESIYLRTERRQTRSLQRMRADLEENSFLMQRNNLRKLNIFMPVLLYGCDEEASKEKEEENQMCSICLLNFEVGEEIRCTPCNHYYHKDCIDTWCESSMSCPMCRRELTFHKELQYFYCRMFLREFSL